MGNFRLDLAVYDEERGLRIYDIYDGVKHVGKIAKVGKIGWSFSGKDPHHTWPKAEDAVFDSREKALGAFSTNGALAVSG